MGQLVSRVALPGVHSYTVTADHRRLVNRQGEHLPLTCWLDPLNGTATAWRPDAIPLLHAKPAFVPSGGRVILYSHGNAEDVAMTVHWINFLSKRFRCAVYAYDYTGYGVNHKHSSESAVYGNISSVVRYLRDTRSFDHIVLYGRSIGSAPALYAAVYEAGIAGVILQSAFRSIVSTCVPFVPPCLDMMLNQQLIKRCSVPVLVIHGTDDIVVPFSHAKILARATCVWDHLWLHGAGHNNIDSEPRFRRELCAKIDHFLATLDPWAPVVRCQALRQRRH